MTRAKHWKHPVPSDDAQVTDLLPRLWWEQAQETRPTAYPTLHRMSDAGLCLRQRGYRGLVKAGVLATADGETGPDVELDRATIDLPGAWRMRLGTLLHNELEAAITGRYSEATVEARLLAQDSSLSGHGDIGYVRDGRKVAFEFKTTGGLGFEYATGIRKRQLPAADGSRWRRDTPKGPKSTAIAQGSLEAHLSEADELRIGLVTLEPIPRAGQRELGLSDAECVFAEWVIPETIWRPLARLELDRFELVTEHLQSGHLPPRTATETWECDYCPFYSDCTAHGPGTPTLVSLERSKA